MTVSRPVIRLLDESLINQIAAGEVVERPASVLKEMMENALDAGATEVIVHVRDGGKTFMSVQDNGCGIEKEQLSLALCRHATSKLSEGDLFKVQSFGFRGEALAAISAVSRFSLISRIENNDHAWRIEAHGGDLGEPTLVTGKKGTLVEVRDLFHAVPARLKFMKSTPYEFSAIRDVSEKIALAHFNVSFSLYHNDRSVLSLKAKDSLEARLFSIAGEDFKESSLPIHIENDVFQIGGWIGLPTLNFSQTHRQMFFVNGRPIKDKGLQSALKVAYHDLLPKERHSAAYVFIKIDPAYVDINVHPAKTEVRFVQPQKLRDALIGCIRGALSTPHTQTSSHLSTETLNAFTSLSVPSNSLPLSVQEVAQRGGGFQKSYAMSSSRGPFAHGFIKMGKRETHSPSSFNHPQVADVPSSSDDSLLSSKGMEGLDQSLPLGYAKAQLFETYILSQTEDAFYLIDQHAAAERISYESLKKEMHLNGVDQQFLLLPEIIEVSSFEKELLTRYQSQLLKMGVSFEFFGMREIFLKAVPARLKEIPPETLIQDVLDDLKEGEGELSLFERLLEKLSKKACHGSIRSGRRLSLEEMNALLRSIEEDPHANQCNHGRPTLIKLTRADLERLFERA